MFCKYCGSQVADGTAFCTVCGAQLGNGSGGQMPPEGQGEYAPGGQAAPGAPFADPAAGAYAQPQPPARKSKLPIVAAIMGAVALVAIAVLVVIMVLNPFGSSDTASSKGGQGAQRSEQTADKAKASPLDLHISQVDNSAFPTMTLYASVSEEGSKPSSDVTAELFTLTEVSDDGTEYVGTIDSIAPLAIGDAMNINLVLDQSGSMSSDKKMTSAKSAANTFVDQIVSTEGNVAEITAFSDYVSNVQPFTNEPALLKSAIGSLSPNGETALFDALYWSLQRTNLKTGSRVVIAFTDGEENASHYSETDVVELSRMTGIPVYIVGIGNSVNRSALQSLASECNGAYFDASTSDLQTALAAIYEEIYENQRSMYRIVYTSSYSGDESKYRSVRLSASDESGYSGESETTYMPVDNVSSYDSSVNAQDYVLPDSASRYYSRSELEKLSLWELYLARNEIYARHGRGFKNQDLVEYFATRHWYHQTATPEEFDSMPSPLNDYERKNAEAMLEIEKERNSPYLVTAK